MPDNKVERLKKDMMTWKDFYGKHIVSTEQIQNATSMKELKEIMHEHRAFLEEQNANALKHLDETIKNFGLAFVW